MGFIVYEEKMPLVEDLAKKVGRKKAVEMALSAGGDFELVFIARRGGLEAKGYELRIGR